MTKSVRMVVCVVSLVVMPRAAAADWFVNPFLGSISNIVFSDPTTASPKVLGISGGAGVRGIVGGEFDYAVSKEFFGSESEIGSNELRLTTGSVLFGYPIKIGGQKRIQPYGSFGGGLGIARTGISLNPDFNWLSGQSVQRQQQIFTCLNGLSGRTTRAQLTSCGVAVINQSQDEEGYTGMLSYGGGVFGFIVSHVGVRADFRYFKKVVESDGDPFTFWRYTFGVVIH